MTKNGEDNLTDEVCDAGSQQTELGQLLVNLAL